MSLTDVQSISACLSDPFILDSECLFKRNRIFSSPRPWVQMSLNHHFVSVVHILPTYCSTTWKSYGKFNQIWQKLCTDELPQKIQIQDPGFEFRGALIELNAVQSKAKHIMGWNLWWNFFSYRFRGCTPGTPVLQSTPEHDIPLPHLMKCTFCLQTDSDQNIKGGAQKETCNKDSVRVSFNSIQWCRRSYI